MKFRYFLMAAGMVVMPFAFSAPAKAAQGDYCREYTKDVRVGGRLQSAYGTACFRPDGSWEIVSMNGYRPLYDDIERQVHQDSRDIIIVRDYRRPVYRPAFFPFVWYSGYHHKSWKPYGHYKYSKKDYRHHDRGRKDQRHHRGRH